MKDLTSSSIVKNILQMALPIAAGMFFQTLYFLIDLYFVAGLGDAAIAGVGAAGNAMFVVMAATQVLGVGTVTLISSCRRAQRPGGRETWCSIKACRLPRCAPWLRLRLASSPARTMCARSARAAASGGGRS